jgi:pimeloyl-ACP methyl ester carboxylesterase
MKRLAWLFTLPFLMSCGPLQGLCLPSREALGMLDQLAAGERRQAEATDRGAIAYEQGGRRYQADLYRPIQALPDAGIVLVPGAAAGGKDDPRLVALAQALARARFAVLVPDIPTLRELRVSPDDVRYVTSAFEHLQSRPELAPEGRAGLAGISYAVGPAFLAALDPLVRDRVRFVLSIGGYHDLTAVITFFTTGYFREGDAWRAKQPDPYGKWVFVMSNAAHLSEPADRAALRELAERKLADPSATIAPPPLSPEGQALWSLLTNEDPTRVPALVSRLPATIRRTIAMLDLADKDLSALRARTILVHGRDDDLIPYTQSLALARDLPADRVRLSVVSGLFHVNLRELKAMDVWRLSCAIQALLAERGR